MYRVTLLIFLILTSSCGEHEKGEYNRGPVLQSDFNPLLKSQVKNFVDTFRKEKFVRDRLVWSGGLENIEFKSTNSPLLRGLVLLEFGVLSKSVLNRNFDAIGYYIERAWIDKVYNNVPVDSAIVELAKDLLDGKYKYLDIVDESTYGRLNTMSELLRVSSILNPKDVLNPKVIRAYPNLNLDKILGIVAKSHYLEVRKVFNKFHSQASNLNYAPSVCARFRSVSSIMKIDPQWTNEIETLKSIAMDFHELLDEPSQIYGRLSDHLTCIEILEEILGRNPDPKTGVGLTERYVKYVASNLWDYPLSGKVCAPFGGVLSFFPQKSNHTVNYCDNNEKSVFDNLLFLKIFERYIFNARITVEVDKFVNKTLDYGRSKKIEAELMNDLHKLNTVSQKTESLPTVKPNKRLK